VRRRAVPEWLFLAHQTGLPHALTPPLSPGERETYAAPLESLFVLPVGATSVAFASELARSRGRPTQSAMVERFPLSWGRGPA